MELIRVPMPPDGEVCVICNDTLWTDGRVIRCEKGHLHPPEGWSTNARSFVIKVWNEIKHRADAE
jgi:hypothetical protein